MKIAMPLAKGRVAELSDHCDRFTMADVDLTENLILDSCRAVPDTEWLGRLGAWLVEQAESKLDNAYERLDGRQALLPESCRDALLRRLRWAKIGTQCLLAE